MILPLFKKEWITNYKLLLILAAVISLYSIMIITMFDPELGESLKMMEESMPEIFAAFGMGDSGTSLLDFIANYLYGFLLIIFPTLCAILLGGKIIAGYVDQGSMVYLLSSSDKRSRLAFTQAAFLALSLLTLVLFSFALGLISCEALFPSELDIPAYIGLNVGLYGYIFFLGGLCFLFSCIFNDSKYAYGTAAGFSIMFILIQMLSQVNDKVDKLKYATPLTLLNTKALIAQDSKAFIGIIILYVTGLILFGAGITIFTKKDLPI